MTRLKIENVDLAVTRLEDGGQWSDTRWQFPVTTAGTPKSTFSMNWAIPLEDGGHFTDAAHAKALDAWKRVLWTMIVTPPDGTPRKGSFCAKFGTGLRFLVPWMIATGRKDLSDLDSSAQREFTDALLAKVIEDAEEDYDDPRSETGITDVTVSSYLTVFSLPYIARRELEVAGHPFPTDDPLSGRDALEIAKEICRKAVRQTPEIPDRVYVSVVNAAMTVLDAPWLEPLIDFCDGFPSARELEQEARCAAFVEGHLPRGRDSTTPPTRIRAAIVDVRAVCQIIIQASTAIRVSELCGIETKGYNAATGLPRCVKLERTFDDEYELFSLDAQLFKHTTSSEPATWVLGMRPTGSSYLPPPVRAIDILYRLDAGWRHFAQIDALFINFTTNHNLPRKREYIGRPSSGYIRTQQQRWMADTGCVPDGQRITTHMWRKTFARYLVRVSADLLPAISHHLKHMSIAMTEIGYCKPDPAVRDLIEDARVEEAGSIIFGQITGQKRVEGPIAAEIRSLGAEFSRRLGNRSTESVARDIEAEVRERRIELYGSEVGWCVFRSESARCHLLADDPTPAFMRLAPAFGRKRADVCQKCANFGIGNEHIGFWRDRRRSLNERLAASDAQGPASIRVSLKRAIERCDTVLAWMGEGGHA